MSRSRLNDSDLDFGMVTEERNFGMAKKASARDVIQTIFTPEDVEMCETLYCLWIAE